LSRVFGRDRAAFATSGKGKKMIVGAPITIRGTKHEADLAFFCDVWKRHKAEAGAAASSSVRPALRSGGRTMPHQGHLLQSGTK
jgi:hypothetical protein